MNLFFDGYDKYSQIDVTDPKAAASREKGCGRVDLAVGGACQPDKKMPSKLRAKVGVIHASVDLDGCSV